MTEKHIDKFLELSKKPLEKHGFIFTPPKEVMDELFNIRSAAVPQNNIVYEDMRDMLWISIDHAETLDIDQLTFAEKISSELFKVYIAISDVDAIVSKNSAVDEYAAHNSTSIYVDIFSYFMLPPELSTNFTSFNEGLDRCALVVELIFGTDGILKEYRSFMAWVNNKAKLNFTEVGNLLEHKVPLPESIPLHLETQEQVLLQKEIKRLINKNKPQKRILNFPTNDYWFMSKEGMLLGFGEVIHTQGHAIVGNYITAANKALAEFVAKEEIPCLRKVIKAPDRWDLIIEIAKERGFTLQKQPDAVALYQFLILQKEKSPETFISLSLAISKFVGRGEYVVGHQEVSPQDNYDFILPPFVRCTAPNRRFADLVNKRLLKNYIHGKKGPYIIDELETIAKHCTQRESAAQKVQRHLRKSVAAELLNPHVGTNYPAIITWVGEKATWVKMLSMPYVEGRLVKGFQGVKLGDVIEVKLVEVDVDGGCIDFQRLI